MGKTSFIKYWHYLCNAFTINDIYKWAAGTVIPSIPTIYGYFEGTQTSMLIALFIVVFVAVMLGYDVVSSALKSIFKKESPLKIDFQNVYFDKDIVVENDRKAGEHKLYYCNVFNSGSEDIENVSISLIHCGQSHKLVFRDIDKKEILIPAGRHKRVDLICHRNEGSDFKRAFIEGTNNNKYISLEYGILAEFEVMVTAKGQTPKINKFSVYIQKHRGMNGFTESRLRMVNEKETNA